MTFSELNKAKFQFIAAVVAGLVSFGLPIAPAQAQTPSPSQSDSKRPALNLDEIMRDIVPAEIPQVSAAPISAAKNKATSGVSQPAPKMSPKAMLPRPKQYIVLSFDGSRSIQMWSEARALAQELNIGLTIFMSGVHFLPESLLKKYYNPPGDKYGPGTSAIKKILDIDRATIPKRVSQVEDAVGEGVEVGSHAVGHFDAGNGPTGLNWSTTDWVSELSQFQNILLNIFQLNGIAERYPGESRVWKQLVGDSLKGFRAPLLATNGTLAPALAKLGYRYDGSEVYPMEWGKWPFKKKDADIWEIPMAQIPIVGTAKKQVAMDYNFYAFDSKAMPDLKNAAFYSERWYNSLMNYFQTNYYGNRAPIHIGAHFDDYNDRAYYNGFFRFARTVCRRPEVVCVTGSELLRKMQSLGPDRIAALQSGKFEKLAKPEGLKQASTLDMKLAWANAGGKLRVTIDGKDAMRVTEDFKVRIYADGKLLSSALGDINVPMATGIQQYEVRIFNSTSNEVLKATRRAQLRAGSVQAIEAQDRETYLQKGDLPGAHGQPDSSGILEHPEFVN